MNIFKEGDQSKGICEHCKKLVSTTFKVQDAPIHDGNATYFVKDVLVGVCDVCNRIVSIPQQSFAAVAEVRKKAEKENLEVRVPRHLLDILNNSILILGIDVTADLRSQLVRLYLADIKAKQYTKIKENLKSSLLRGSFKKSSRLSVRVTSQLEDIYETFLKKSHFSKTDLVYSVIVEVKKDILDKKSPSKIHEIRTALLAAG